MTAVSLPPTLSDPYQLVSVQAVAAPAGATGMLWHRYEIAQGTNRIVGYRQGRHDNVTVAVEGLIEQLNQRRLRQRGRVHITPQSKLRSVLSSGR